jgi:hypothetical protein
MDDRPGSFLECAQVRIKMHRKEYGWSVGLVYDPRELSRVATTRPGVAGVLQMVSELTLVVLRTRMDQLRRIWWCTDQRCRYVRMARESSVRDMV